MAGPTSVKDDWKINTAVKRELVKRWIDPGKLRISTVKGVVNLKGVLTFTGKGQDDAGVLTVVMGILKNLELAILAIPQVRSVHFKMEGWKKTGGRWAQISAKKEEG
ncbi:hypothetical protein KAI68_07645 [bacterium]|nr:hypothetical protein [bacterium]